MTKKGLTLEELCAILKACGEARVTELKFGDLHVHFGKAAQMETNQVGSHVDMAPDPRAAKEIAGNQIKEAKRSLELDEMRVRNEQISELFLTDPLRAEELLRNGELDPDEFDTSEEA